MGNNKDAPKKGIKQKGSSCVVCGTTISETTAAKVAHMRKHVRDGSLVENKDKSGKCVWETTGNKPKDPTELRHSWRPAYAPKNKLTAKPRKLVTAKYKKDKIYIKCRECKKWIKKAAQDFCDCRFVASTCPECDVISPFPKRVVDKLMKNPGQEITE